MGCYVLRCVKFTSRHRENPNGLLVLFFCIQFAKITSEASIFHRFYTVFGTTFCAVAKCCFTSGVFGNLNKGEVILIDSLVYNSWEKEDEWYRSWYSFKIKDDIFYIWKGSIDLND